MINTKLIDFLPEDISDEAAYHLANFMTDLALALQNHYSDQLQRSIDQLQCSLKEISQEVNF